MKLTPEQVHATLDLVLYAVNTRELYPDAIATMQMRATFGIAPTDLFGWARFARKARGRYTEEIAFRGAAYSTAVLIAAAREIRDYYAEQQAEITASMKGPDA